LFVKQAI